MGSKDVGDVSMLLWRAARAWRRRLDDALKPIGLTHVEFLVLQGLELVCARGPQAEASQQEIADASGVHKAVVSRTIGVLEHHGLIDRDVQQDMRCWALLPTDEARRRLDRARPVVAAATAELLARVANADRFVRDLNAVALKS